MNINDLAELGQVVFISDGIFDGIEAGRSSIYAHH